MCYTHYGVIITLYPQAPLCSSHAALSAQLPVLD